MTLKDIFLIVFAGYTVSGEERAGSIYSLYLDILYNFFVNDHLPKKAY